MAHYNYKNVAHRPDFNAAIEPAMKAAYPGEDHECDGDPGYDGDYWLVADFLLDQKDKEIGRLRKLVDLAVDAYNAGGEDECCVACMKIYEQKDAALA